MMKKLLLILLFLPIFLFAKDVKTRTYRIGFSQCTEEDAWRKAMQSEIENALLLNSNLELIVKGAKGNSIVQVQQIRELINEGIDILVVSPNESKPLTPIISEIYKTGIPVVIVDRKIDSKEYTQYIGADNYEIGFQAGRYAVDILGGIGEVMEIWGLPGSSPAMERHNGFVAAIKDYSKIKITTSTTGEWDIEKAKLAVKPFLDSKATIDLVFAHNDFMALGAYDVFSAEQKDNIPPIIGIDGLFGQEGGVQGVIKGELAATFLYSTGGNEIIASVLAILRGESIPKVVNLPTVAIDHNNAEAINAQMRQIVQLGGRIKSARAVLKEQEALYESQGFRLRLLFFALLAISIIIVGGAIAYHRLSLHKKKN